jgi:hypothetical protein
MSSLKQRIVRVGKTYYKNMLRQEGLTSQSQHQTGFNDKKENKNRKFISLTALPLKKGESNCDLRERLLHHGGQGSAVTKR